MNQCKKPQPLTTKMLLLRYHQGIWMAIKQLSWIVAMKQKVNYLRCGRLMMPWTNKLQKLQWKILIALKITKNHSYRKIKQKRWNARVRRAPLFPARGASKITTCWTLQTRPFIPREVAKNYCLGHRVFHRILKGTKKFNKLSNGKLSTPKNYTIAFWPKVYLKMARKLKLRLPTSRPLQVTQERCI